jgi:nodulation efficiency protein D
MFWAIATAIFAILEIVIPGLVTIWLALAALIVTLLAGFINNSKVEFLIFSVFSLIFVIFTRPVLRRYIQKTDKNFSSQMKGYEIKIEKVVNTDKLKKEYEVKFKGSIWTGISEEFFKAGDIVKIKNFEGNKIVLEKK